MLAVTLLILYLINEYMWNPKAISDLPYRLDNKLFELGNLGSL